MKKMTQTLIGSVLATAGLLAATSAMAGKTLDQIKQRGQIVCGVNTGLAGFSAADSSGNWSGLDVDHCRAVAAAVLSDATKVKYVPLTAQQRFPALPDVPPVADSLPGFENIGWFGLMFPAGAPKAIIDRVHADVLKALADPEMKKRFEAQGQSPVGNSPAEFAKVIRDETVFWGKIVRERKIAVQ